MDKKKKKEEWISPEVKAVLAKETLFNRPDFLGGELPTNREFLNELKVVFELLPAFYANPYLTSAVMFSMPTLRPYLEKNFRANFPRWKITNYSKNSIIGISPKKTLIILGPVLLNGPFHMTTP